MLYLILFLEFMVRKQTFLLLVIFAPIIAVLLTSCISIRSKYEPVNYYLLQQTPLLAGYTEKFPTQLIVREFRISSQYETEHLLAFQRDGIKLYYYHRWLNMPNILVTDYLITRLNRHNVFSGGVHSFSTIAVSDYYLEGTINEFIAFNDEKRGSSENFVIISIQATFLKREKLKVADTVLFSNLYETKVFRKDNSVTNIADTFSRGLAEIADKIMGDIIQALRDEFVE